MISLLVQAYEFDIRMRLADEHASATGVVIRASDIHTTPEQGGEVLAKTKPRLAVYSHIVRPMATEADLIPATRKTYAGPLELGEDLMLIEIGDAITVRRPTAPVR